MTASVSGALFHEVRMPHVCSAISIRIEYGISSSRGAPAKNLLGVRVGVRVRVRVRVKRKR